MTNTDVSIIVTTFERPGHLAKCLRSLANQDFEPACCEVVVADDGSRGGETEACVAEFAQRWTGSSTRFLTQVKEGFRLATCRNKAAAIARGKALIFLDGDCIVPPKFVRVMLDELRANVVVAGDCYRLTQEATKQIDASKVDTWDLESTISREESKRLSRKALRARIYSFLSIPMRPRLTGCAFACFREDLIGINGFDENFVGWGFEDRDIQRRFLLNGIRTRTVLHRVKAVHLWHPSDPTFARNGVGTANRTYYQTAPVKAFCQRGVSQYLDGSVAFQAYESVNPAKLATRGEDRTAKSPFNRAVGNCDSTTPAPASLSLSIS